MQIKMSSGEQIKIIELSKRYKKSSENSLDDVSFTICKGEKIGIIGPNGAGKTTLMSILCGIIKPTTGKYFFYDNKKVLCSNEIKKRLAFVPQEYAFYEDLSLMQNLNFFGALYKFNKKEIIERSNEILSALNINNLANKKIKTLSGGTKRKINLAISLLSKPQILILDEPTVGADVQSKQAMLAYLNYLNSSLGTTIVYTSHHLSEAEKFCSCIAFINKGKLIAYNTVDKLLYDYNVKDLNTLFLKLTNTNLSN